MSHWPKNLTQTHDDNHSMAIFYLNWRMTPGNLSETISRINCALKQMSRSAIVAVNERLRMHDDCHNLIAHRLKHWLEPVTCSSELALDGGPSIFQEVTFSCMSFYDAVRIFDPFQREGVS